MEKKKLLLVIICVCIVLLSGLLVSKVAYAQSDPELKPQTWKLAHISSPTHYFHLHCYTWLANEIEKRTNGKIKVKIFPAQALGKFAEQWETLTSGRADIAFVLPTLTPGLTPILSLGELPFAFNNHMEAYVVMKKLYKTGYLDKVLYNDVKVIGLHPCTLEQIFSVKPIKSMADLKNLRIRTAGALCSKVLQAVNTSPVTIPTPEVYMALKQGMVDGAIMEPANAYMRKLFEPCKYVLEIPFFTVILNTFMNKKVWDELPKDTQTKLDALFEEFGWRFQGIFTQSDISVRTVHYPKMGVQSTYFPPNDIEQLKEVTKGIWDEWVDLTVQKGVPKDRAQKAFEEFKTILANYGFKYVKVK
jgi:TRAP-type C4-dicarboxylate transport system substrate-binding protein